MTPRVPTPPAPMRRPRRIHSTPALCVLAASLACTSPRVGRVPEASPAPAVVPGFVPMTVLPVPAIPRPAVAAGGSGGLAISGRSVDARDVLLAMFENSDLSLLVDDRVTGTATFDVKAKSAVQAFEAFLRHLDLAFELSEGLVRVTPRQRRTFDLDLLDRDPGQSSESSSANAEQTGVWEQVGLDLQTVVGDAGSILVNPVAGMVEVEASPATVARVERYVEGLLERATSQVTIEARVLEVRLEDEFRLGVDWTLFPDALDLDVDGILGGGGVISQGAASGSDAFQIGFENVDKLTLFIDALERQGQVRVLSSPRISTMNNVPATLHVVDQIPVIEREVQNSEGGFLTQFDVRFEEAGVAISVVPQIGRDGTITVWVNPVITEQTGVVVTPDGLQVEPIIATREAETTVRVRDGQTIVIGGLRSTRKSEALNGVPLLSSLPGVGALFRSTIQEREEVELVVLLVPRILDPVTTALELERGASRMLSARRVFEPTTLGLEAYGEEDYSRGLLTVGSGAIGDGRRDLGVPAVESTPDDALTITMEGLSRRVLLRAARALEEGRLHESAHLLDQVLALDPERLEAWMLSGIVHSGRGEPAAARRALDRVLARLPDDALALGIRGLIEYEAGAPEAAAAYLDRAWRIEPSVLHGSNLGAALLAAGRTEEAYVLLASLELEATPLPEPHANLAWARHVLGDEEGSRAQIALALRKGASPRSAAMRALLAVR